MMTTTPRVPPLWVPPVDVERERQGPLPDAPAQALADRGPRHTLGANASPVWLDPADPHAPISSYKGIIVADPATSILLTKAAHEGPALPSDMTADVKAWATAEATTISTTAPPTNASTTAIAIPNGAASVDSPAPGGRITFTASMASGIPHAQDRHARRADERRGSTRRACTSRLPTRTGRPR